MKLIRSSKRNYGFFCLYMPPLLLEYFNVQSDLSSFLSSFFSAVLLQLRFVVLGVKH